jgi:hypothetical protein
MPFSVRSHFGTDRNIQNVGYMAKLDHTTPTEKNNLKLERGNADTQRESTSLRPNEHSSFCTTRILTLDDHIDRKMLRMTFKEYFKTSKALRQRYK